jgi:hypothetical protein
MSVDCKVDHINEVCGVQLWQVLDEIVLNWFYNNSVTLNNTFDSVSRMLFFMFCITIDEIFSHCRSIGKIKGWVAVD